MIIVVICGGVAAGMVYIITAYIAICNWINAKREEKLNPDLNQQVIEMHRDSIE